MEDAKHSEVDEEFLLEIANLHELLMSKFMKQESSAKSYADKNLERISEYKHIEEKLSKLDNDDYIDFITMYFMGHFNQKDFEAMRKLFVGLVDLPKQFFISSPHLKNYLHFAINFRRY